MNKFERALNDTINGRSLKPSDPYDGWAKDDFAAFLKRLHKVLRRNDEHGVARLEGIGCTIKREDFDTMLPDELRADEGCVSHYIFNVASSMGYVGAWANYYKYTGPIHYVFATGDGENGNLERFFASIRKDEHATRFFRLSNATKEGYELKSAKSEPSIQAADVGAYEYVKLGLHCLDNNYEIDPEMVRKSVLNLCREPSNHFPLLLAGRMKEAFEAMVRFKKKHGSAYGQLL